MPPPAALSAEEIVAIRAWNIMGGEINWAAIPMLCEFFDVRDPERFIYALAAIRDAQRRQDA